MCGEIRKSPNHETAVQWAISYAKTFEEADEDYQRWDPGYPNDDNRRPIAKDFIQHFVPVQQRAAALDLLAEMPDPLKTDVNFWSTVIY